MEDIQIFKNDTFGEVRTKEVNNEVWFCLADVCKALGIENPRVVKTRLNEAGVCTTDVRSESNNGVIQSREMTFVNESNLYKVIFQSKKAEAEIFTEWITSEVIPSIRKNGGYIANQEKMTPEQIVANALIVANNIIDTMKAQVEEMKPKALYFDNLVDRKLNMSIRETANELGVKQTSLINYLLDNKYLYRDTKNKLTAYAKYLEQGDGLFTVKEYTNEKHSGNQTLVTPKGRETFRLLKEVM